VLVRSFYWRLNDSVVTLKKKSIGIW